MTQALRSDLTVLQGTSWTAAWQFLNGASPLVDNTWSLTAQVRSTVADATVLFTWSTASGNASIGNDGTVTLSVDPAVSDAWGWSAGVYDVKVTKAGVTYRLVEGRVTVSPQVTRP